MAAQTNAESARRRLCRRDHPRRALLRRRRGHGRFELSSFLEIAQTDDGGACSATIPAEGGGVYAGGAARRDVSLPLAAIVAAAAQRTRPRMATSTRCKSRSTARGPLRRAMALARPPPPCLFGPSRRRPPRPRPPTAAATRRSAVLDRRPGADHHDGALRRPRELHGRHARPQDRRPLAAGLPEARAVGAGLGVSSGRGAAAAGGQLHARSGRRRVLARGLVAPRALRRVDSRSQRVVAGRAASARRAAGAAPLSPSGRSRIGSSSCGSRRSSPTPQPTSLTTSRRARRSARGAARCRRGSSAGRPSTPCPSHRSRTATAGTRARRALDSIDGRAAHVLRAVRGVPRPPTRSSWATTPREPAVMHDRRVVEARVADADGCSCGAATAVCDGPLAGAEVRQSTVYFSLSSNALFERSGEPSPRSHPPSARSRRRDARCAEPQSVYLLCRYARSRSSCGSPKYTSA